MRAVVQLMVGFAFAAGHPLEVRHVCYVAELADKLQLMDDGGVGAALIVLHKNLARKLADRVQLS
jgi:hypothetical protein